tara:strand:+ start:85 stop:303 length:219 start_codon:yes stop_codon:yes gene_type:complete
MPSNTIMRKKGTGCVTLSKKNNMWQANILQTNDYKWIGQYLTEKKANQALELRNLFGIFQPAEKYRIITFFI